MMISLVSIRVGREIIEDFMIELERNLVKQLLSIKV